MGESDLKVVSVVSACRSGSTLLDMLLGSADGCFSAGELRYLWERGLIAHRLCGCGADVTECPVWSKVLAAGGLSYLDPTEVVDWQHQFARVRHTPRLLEAHHARDRDPALSKLVATMTALYREIARVTRARVIVDSSKRPADAALAALIPDIQTYVVHLIRDPRAVSYSRQRPKAELDGSRREMERRPVTTTAANWVWVNAMASRLQASPNLRYLRVRYEDLLADPEGTLGRIYTFVGESQAVADVGGGRARLETNHTVSGSPTRFYTGLTALEPDEEWQRAMTPLQWSTATAIALPAIHTYGYAVETGAPWRRAARAE